MWLLKDWWFKSVGAREVKVVHKSLHKLRPISLHSPVHWGCLLQTAQHPRLQQRAGPMRARPQPTGWLWMVQGGVLRRPGHTEASVDLARLAGCRPAGVLCEIVNKDGTMARMPQLLRFAKEHGLKCITILDLVRYRLKHDQLVECTAVAPLTTR